MGKHKYIETPERMWELFEAYRTHAKAKPVLVQDFVGKDGMEVYRKKERPLTMEGFELYLSSSDEINDLGDYFSNKDDRYSEYATICSRIRKAIREDQITGGMVGIYNQSITQRLNGLTDKQEIKTFIEQPLFPDVPTNDSDK